MDKEIEKLEKTIAKTVSLKALVGDQKAWAEVEKKTLVGLKGEERVQKRLAIRRARIKRLKEISARERQQYRPKGKGKKKRGKMLAATESAILDEIKREEKKLEVEKLREELRLLQEDSRPKKPKSKTEKVRKRKVKKTTKKTVKRDIQDSKEKDMKKVVISDLSSILEEEDFIEGKKTKRYSNYYERDPRYGFKPFYIME